MYTRHQEVPVYQYREGVVTARVYNQIRLAVSRLHSPVRMALPGLKNLDVILQDDAWIIVDRNLHDVPVIAWTGFDTKQRDNLHRPLLCQIRLFHVSAGLILSPGLKAIEMLAQKAVRKES